MPPDMAGMVGGPPQPPPPPDEQLPEPSFKDVVLSLLQKMTETQGADAVRDQTTTMPKEVLATLRDWQMDDPYAATILDPILPPEEETPDYPKWFREQGPPPRPSIGDVTEMVERDWMEWSDVREAIYANLIIYHSIEAGAYKDFNKDTDELFYDESLVGEVDSILARHATTKVRWRFEAQRSELRSDAQRAEDFVSYCFQGANRRVMRSGYHDIRRELAFYLTVTGYACARTGMRLDDAAMPFDFMLVDPSTTVPTWDDRGLERVTRKYQDQVSRVISAFDTGDGAVRRKLLDAPVGGTEDQFRRLDEYVTVMEYDDRWWRIVLVDGKEIVNTAHKYGFTPWIVQGSQIGEALAVTSAIRDSEVYPSAGLRGGDNRIRYKHQSYFDHVIRGHRQKETVLSKLYTLWKKSDKPSWFWFFDEYSRSKGIPENPNTTQTIIPLQQNHEDLRPFVDNINPNVFGTLFQSITSTEQRTRMPLETFGQMQGTQQSGNQMEGAAESGYEKEAPIIGAEESFYAQLGEMWLCMWRDWGYLWEDGSENYGRIEVPYQNRLNRRGAEPTFTIVPAVIKRVGTRIDAKMPRIRTQGLAALGNAVSMWKGMGLMSDSEALDLRGVEDVDEVLAEIEYDEVRNDPAMKSLRRYRILKEFDPELAELYREATLKKEQPPQMPPGMGPGMPMPGMQGPMGMGGPPPPPMGSTVIPPDVNTSGMNLAGLGLGPQGPTGRPMGPTGPTSMSPVQQMPSVPGM